MAGNKGIVQKAMVFIWMKTIAFWTIPSFSPIVDLDSQKKEILPYPRCGFGACLRCGRAF